MPARYTPERFWSKIEILGPDDCWLWTGCRTRDPYGNPSYGHLVYQGTHYVAHRLAWILTFGDPGKLRVLHKCDNPPCCNPGHLFLGTQKDNMIDRREKGRHRHHPKRDAITGRWVRGKGEPV